MWTQKGCSGQSNTMPKNETKIMNLMVPELNSERAPWGRTRGKGAGTYIDGEGERKVGFGL